MEKKPIVAIMYDFDKTLCTEDMENYSFIPSINMTPSEFWSKANEFGAKEHMDGILAYMFTMIKECEKLNISFSKQSLFEDGKKIKLFDGVKDWFDRINRYGDELGVTVEHYVISSGLKEIILGSGIADKFKEIYACEFYYDESGKAVWPKTAVNYTNKTQFVYRINKGVLDIANDKDLNESMPDDSKRIPFSNMIYIGDGLTDVPCMKMMKSYGGVAIAVYQDNYKERVNDMLQKDRVDFIFPANYEEGTELDKTMKNIIKKMSIVDTLVNENSKQKKNI